MIKPAYERLKPAHRRFVDMIVQGVKGTHAVKKLRPKLRRPDILASKWRAREDVRAAIEERLDQAMEDAGITNAQILLGLAETANFDMRKLSHGKDCDCSAPAPCAKLGQPKKLHELDDETARVLQGVRLDADGSIDFRIPNRTEARKLLGQHKKLFTQNVVVDGHLTLEQLVGASMKPTDHPQ